MQSLLFNFLDELLFVFHTELTVCCSLNISKLDRQSWTIEATGCEPRWLITFLLFAAVVLAMHVQRQA